MSDSGFFSKLIMAIIPYTDTHAVPAPCTRVAITRILVISDHHDHLVYIVHAVKVTYNDVCNKTNAGYA